MAFEQYIDDFKSTFEDTVSDVKGEVNKFLSGPTKFNAGTLLRYPMTLGSSDYENMPFVLFMITSLQYENQTPDKKIEIGNGTFMSVNDIKSPRDVKSNIEDFICLYMPNSISISDTARYENMKAEGLIASMFSEDGLTLKDFQTALQKQIASALGGVGKELLKGADVQSPKEFMTYSSPAIREFAFTYKFMPKSYQESKNVEEIIKRFRRAMYPIQASDYRYSIPNSFSITFNNVQGVTKIPQVILTSCQVNYNPTNPTYLSDPNSPTGNRPAEIDLTLSFQEIEAIHRRLVEEGY